MSLLLHGSVPIFSGGNLSLNLDQFCGPQSQGQRTFELPAGSVRETTRLDQGRLFSRLDYPDGGHDAFEFQTFSAEELAGFAEPLGLRVDAACTNFDAGTPPSADNPRIQFVLARA